MNRDPKLLTPCCKTRYFESEMHLLKTVHICIRMYYLPFIYSHRADFAPCQFPLPLYHIMHNIIIYMLSKVFS